MDVINSEILLCGRGFYRINVRKDIVEDNGKIQESGSNLRLADLHDDVDECDWTEQENGTQCRNDIAMVGDHFVGQLNVPSIFICFVIGKGGETKKKIEFDTQTIIVVPKEGKGNNIKVTGKNKSSVDRALTRICMLVDLGRNKVPFTHFISVPANFSHIQEQFESFKSTVLHECIGDRNVDESVFQRSYKLHVTVCVVVLGDQGEVDQMVETCQEFRKQNAELFKTPIRVHLCGVECMNDDPCEVRVLYAKVQCEDNEHGYNRLQTLADGLVDHLVDKRILVQREYSRVTLHMTLMNGTFNQDKDLEMDGGDPGHGRAMKTIDCSNILRKYSDWDFGDLDIEEVQLCRRHGSVPGAHYKSVASFRLGGTSP